MKRRIEREGKEQGCEKGRKTEELVKGNGEGKKLIDR